MVERESFKYEIVERIAKLSEYGDTSKELNIVSYNGQKPKYDLRTWRHENGGEKLLKGLTLTVEEAHLLKEALNGRTDL